MACNVIGTRTSRNDKYNLLCFGHPISVLAQYFSLVSMGLQHTLLSKNKTRLVNMVVAGCSLSKPWPPLLY